MKNATLQSRGSVGGGDPFSAMGMQKGSFCFWGSICYLRQAGLGQAGLRPRKDGDANTAEPRARTGLITERPDVDVCL